MGVVQGAAPPTRLTTREGERVPCSSAGCELLGVGHLATPRAEVKHHQQEEKASGASAATSEMVIGKETPHQTIHSLEQSPTSLAETREEKRRWPWPPAGRSVRSG